MKSKSTFPAPSAPTSPALVHGSPHGQGPVLPTTSIRANFGLNKPVIGWMSAITFDNGFGFGRHKLNVVERNIHWPGAPGLFRVLPRPNHGCRTRVLRTGPSGRTIH